ncbi:beta-ketoacyl-ACP synthase III [bacterium]
MHKSRVISTGYYLPEKILTNKDLERIVDTNDEWITKRTGIKERRIADDKEASSDIGFEAAKKALDRSGLKPDQIDIVICATITSDYITPSTACLVQDRLGLKNAFAFDISAACAGFVYALDIADKYILQDPNKKVLVVATEKLSTITDWEDRNTCILFGDGAGAAVLVSDESGHGIFSSYLRVDGSLSSLLMVPAGGSRKPVNIGTLHNREHFLTMKGNDVFKHAVNNMSDAVLKSLDLAGFSLSDIDMVFPHQANIRIIKAVRKKLGLAKEQVFINIDKIANTSAATIAISLAQAEESGLLKKGHNIVLVSFGAGLTWGAMTLKW